MGIGFQWMINCEVGLDQRELISYLHHTLDQLQPHFPAVELEYAYCSCGMFFEGWSTENVGFFWKKNYNGGGESSLRKLLRRGKRERGEAREKEKSSLQRKRERGLCVVCSWERLLGHRKWSEVRGKIKKEREPSDYCECINEKKARDTWSDIMVQERIWRGPHLITLYFI